MAARTAAEISELWQVPVTGLTFREMKATRSASASAKKFLVNHVIYEYACTLLPKNKSAVIPIKVHASEETIRLLSQIKPNSSVLLLRLRRDRDWGIRIRT